MFMILHSVYHLVRLMRSQWLIPSEIEAIQRRKLKAILKHAYENVDYYRQIFDSAGVKPEEIKDQEDLLRIPITHKKQLQALPIEKVTAKGTKLKECTKVKTSGSTGIPFDIWIGKKEFRIRGAVMMRSLLTNGYRLTDKAVLIAGVPREMPHHWYQSFGIRRQKFISMLETVDDQIRQVEEEKPDLLSINPSHFPFIAGGLKKVVSQGNRPKMITTGGCVLTEETREQIETVLGVKVLDYYNCWEFGNIAWECRQHAGYHINADSLIVEVIEDGRRVLPGERGEIIITSLNAYTMPLVRYRIGDIGVLSDRRCPCGRGLPLVEKIEGRTDDVIRLPDGKRVLPLAITLALRFIPGIAQFRFVQEEENEFWVYLVQREPFCQNTLERVDRELRRILGDPIRLHIQIMDEIPRDPSGKLRAVISKVKS